MTYSYLKNSVDNKIITCLIICILHTVIFQEFEIIMVFRNFFSSKIMRKHLVIYDNDVLVEALNFAMLAINCLYLTI